jgi:chromate transport protein ChrA
MAGLRGVIVSVGGMMVPAAIITAAATAFLGEIAQHPLTIAALAGIGPVAGGMTIGLAFTLLQPVLQRGRYAVLDVAVVIAAFGILIGGYAQSLLVILAGGALGAVFLRRERPTASDAPMS